MGEPVQAQPPQAAPPAAPPPVQVTTPDAPPAAEPPAAPPVPPPAPEPPATPAEPSAAGDSDALRADAMAELEGSGTKTTQADPGLFAQGSAAPEADDDDPFDLKSRGLGIGDLLVAEQPGADPDEVLHINPRYVAIAKSGVAAEPPHKPNTQPNTPGAVQGAPVLHGVTVWLDNGRMMQLVHRWEDRLRAERFVTELKKVW